DALDLGSCGATRKSSSLFTRTTLSFRPRGLRVAGHISFESAMLWIKKHLICLKKTIKYHTQ
ncbi:MAG: hypothetical protein IKL95_03535, partial [Alphaproteobacteria bacterium]|nr:hypothetical protein [Alphaproteobacteria bacterium]